MKKAQNIQIVCWLLLLLSLSVGIIIKKAEESVSEVAHDEFIDLAREVIGQKIKWFACHANSYVFYLNSKNIYRKLRQLESVLYWSDEVSMKAFCQGIEITEQDSFHRNILYDKRNEKLCEYCHGELQPKTRKETILFKLLALHIDAEYYGRLTVPDCSIRSNELKVSGLKSSYRISDTLRAEVFYMGDICKDRRYISMEIDEEFDKDIIDSYPFMIKYKIPNDFTKKEVAITIKSLSGCDTITETQIIPLDF